MRSDRLPSRPLCLLGVLGASVLLLGGCSLLMLPIRMAAWAVEGFIRYFPLFALVAAGHPLNVPPGADPAAVHASVELEPLDSLVDALHGEYPGHTATLYLVDPDWAAACSDRGPLGRMIADRHDHVSPVGFRNAAALVNSAEDTRRFLDDLEARGIRVEAIGPAAEAFLAQAW